MKSKLNTSEECISNYPCLKMWEDPDKPSNNKIVLFSGRDKGTVVWVGKGCRTPIGYDSDSWLEMEFTPCVKGTEVVLEA